MVSLQSISRDMSVILSLTLSPSPFLLFPLGMHSIPQIHTGLKRVRIKKLIFWRPIFAKTIPIPIRNEHEREHISEMETNALQPDYFETPK